MADLSTFLADGASVPAGSAVTATQTNTVLPEWYTNYAMQVLANQGAASAMPYQPYQGPRVAEFSPTQQQGFNMTGQAATAYQPGLNAAVAGTQNVMNQPGALTAAQPLINQANQSTVANIGQYMNPYTEDVVNRIGDLGVRNLTERLMPAINSKYIQAGQLGYGPRGGSVAPSGMMTDTARALRDTNADILAQQAAALQSGYTQAAGLSAADLERAAKLASTTGDLANTQATTGLNAAQQMGALGASAQSLGLTGANAVMGVGQQQQAQAQKNLDVGYQDFLAQRGYTQDQINNMMNAIKGIVTAVPTSVSKTGIEPTGVTPPSTAATIGGGLLTAASLLDKLKSP